MQPSPDVEVWTRLAKKIGGRGLGDDGSNMDREDKVGEGDGIDTNTVQRCRVDDGPEINTGVECGQISEVEG